MTFAQFHNGLRILLNIDRHDLVERGIIKANDNNAWGEFRRDPFRWFVKAPDAKAKAIWALVEARQVRP